MPVVFVIVTLLFLYGVRQQFLYININERLIDQGSYISTAVEMKASNYMALTDRNRMPAYPFLLSLIYDLDMSDEELFAQGKLFNIGLALLILPVLYLIFRHYLPLFTAVNLLLIHTFAVYIFKAAYVQTELLFYLLSFLTYLLMCRLLWQPSWKWAVLAGILAGLTHLTKASVLPGLALFVTMAILQALAYGLKTKFAVNHHRQFGSYLATPALVVLLFLITLWPYIQNSKEHFGYYFYNVNSTFYIWYDGWDDVRADSSTRAHGDRVGWPAMPEEQIPSAAKYFREHSITQIGQRLANGFLVTLVSMSILESYGYLKYMILLFGLVLGLLVFNRQRAFIIVKGYPYLALFVLSYFIGYLTLYAWYSPIANGNRLVLALFSPFMFTFTFLIYRLFTEQLTIKLSRQSHRTVNLGSVLNWAMLGVLLVDVYFILTYRVGTLFGGF